MPVLNGVLYPKRAMSNDTPITSQTLTVSTAAVSFTGFTAPNAVNGVQLVVFDVQGNDVRCFWEGTTPTGTTGHILPASSAYAWDCAQFNAAQFIRISTATADAVIVASPFMISA